MHVRSLVIAAAVVAAAMLSATPGRAQARGEAKNDNTNPRTARFGVWDNSTNPNNVMKYEPYEKDGSKLTVSNPSNPAQDWSYVTLFDGVYRPVQGQEGAETAVEIINPKSIRIYNKRNGVLQQVVIRRIWAEHDPCRGQQAGGDQPDFEDPVEPRVDRQQQGGRSVCQVAAQLVEHRALPRNC